MIIVCLEELSHRLTKNMTRSTAFAPATPSGGISRLIPTTWVDEEAFIAKTQHEQSQINLWRADPEGPTKIINHSASISSGPFGFLAVRQPVGGGRPEVTVFHAIRAYMANPLELQQVDAILRDKAYVFAGEIYLDEGVMTLPSVFVQPVNLCEVLTPQAVKVPTEAALQAAWATYDATAGDPVDSGELMAARLENKTLDIPQLMVIPTLFIPLLIDRPTPREAWGIVKNAVEKFPEGERPQEFDEFDRMV